MEHETKEILSAVLNKLESMDAKIDGLSNEVVEIRKDLNEFRDEMYKFKIEMYEFRDEMYEFKKETYWRFDNVDRQLRLINADMDHMNHEIAQNKREINKLKTT